MKLINRCKVILNKSNNTPSKQHKTGEIECGVNKYDDDSKDI